MKGRGWVLSSFCCMKRKHKNTLTYKTRVERIKKFQNRIQSIKYWHSQTHKYKSLESWKKIEKYFGPKKFKSNSDISRGDSDEVLFGREPKPWFNGPKEVKQRGKRQMKWRNLGSSETWTERDMRNAPKNTFR